MKAAQTVDDYIASYSSATRTRLKTIRQIVKEEAPEATEKLSYGMPYYSLNGRLLYFAAFKDHVSLFAMPAAIVEFATELTEYQTSKGTIRFSLDKPLPVELIRKIVKFRARQNLTEKK